MYFKGIKNYIYSILYFDFFNIFFHYSTGWRGPGDNPITKEFSNIVTQNAETLHEHTVND